MHKRRLLSTLAVIVGLVATTGAAAGATLIGTAGPDRLIAPSTDPTSTLRGRGGDDVLIGGRGKDTLAGGAGDDRLTGAAQNDELYGSTGNDRLTGGPDDDMLNGGAGRDGLDGGAGRDRIIDGPGDDTILAGPGADMVEVGAGRDRVSLGLGDDSVFGAADALSEVIDCGPGRDAALYVDPGDILRGCEIASVVTISAIDAPASVPAAVSLHRAGQFTCARHADATATCWGYDRLTKPDDVWSFTTYGPIHAFTLHNIAWIGGQRSDASPCRITPDGRFGCWSTSSALVTGEPGDQTASVPGPIVDMRDGCVLTAAGEVRCGRYEPSKTVTWPVEQTGVRSLSEESSTVCALMDDGTARCRDDRGTWSTVPDASNLVDLAVNGDRGCGVSADHVLSCWPLPGTTEFVPRWQLPGVLDVSMGAGLLGGELCVVREDRTVGCTFRAGWPDGAPSFDPFVPTIPAPTLLPIGGIDDAQSVDVANQMPCAIRTSGRVACWEVVPQNFSRG